MIQKRIDLKQKTSDTEYTEFCNMCERQGVFVSCGSCDDKHVIVQFEDDVDLLAWLCVVFNAKVTPIGGK
jgi:hypothetical protein